MMVATLQRLRRVSDLRFDPDPSADGDYREIQGVQESSFCSCFASVPEKTKTSLIYSRSSGRTPSELEALCKEERMKGRQLGCERITTTNPTHAVIGASESPTTARKQNLRRRH
ncbi:hypothetical protein Rs2_36176 [Raphanus sativus]|nr:hypothetical protein Rs2_36176 [Raphanus sativus]